ncbi:MAG: hypothetical protein V3R99_03790 [Thermoguttaceae bacterium]
MPLESRIFTLAKDPEDPSEYQDAYAVDPAGSIAVVADGVASAIFSGQWASVLAEATVAAPPDPDDSVAFADWLAQQRVAWAARIDTTGLAWFQTAKLPMGAFSTLLWVEVQAIDQQQEGAFGAYRLRSFAIGDSCLFHVRHGEVLRTFPVENAAQLEADPLVLGSVDLNRDPLMQFVSIDELCYPDDVLVLCTDAVADWALRCMEAGTPPDWNAYWNMTEQQWRDEVVALRNQRQMRCDDATLLLLRVREEGFEPVRSEASHVEQAAEIPVETDPAQVAADQGPIDVQPIEDEPIEVELVEEPPEGSQDDWKEKFKEAGGQLAEGIELASKEAMRGWKKWKQKAVDKYHEKFDRPDESD